MTCFDIWGKRRHYPAVHSRVPYLLRVRLGTKSTAQKYTREQDLKALVKEGKNVQEIADELGIKQPTVRGLLRKYGLKVKK